MVIFYLLIVKICKNKSRLVKMLTYNFYVLWTTIFISWKVCEKVIFFLSNFHWQEVVFSWFFSTSYVGTSTCLVSNILAVLQIKFVLGSLFPCTYFCVSGISFYLGFLFQSHLLRLMKMSSQASELLLMTSFENGLITWILAFLVVSNTTN
jgi:hypothetical protein